MKKITIIFLTLFLVSSSFAFTPRKSSTDGATGHKFQIKEVYHSYTQAPVIGKYLSKLRLSTKQKKKVVKYINEYKKIRRKVKKENAKVKSLKESFALDSFEKSKYVELLVLQNQRKVQNIADTVEKVYNVLTTKQKTRLAKRFGVKKNRAEKFVVVEDSNSSL